MLQTLLKENQAAYTTISVLEGMNAFKCHMEGHNVLKGLRGQCIIVSQQLADLIGNILRQRGVITTNLIGQFFVLPYRKPILAAVAGANLQYVMKFLYKLLG